MSKGKTNVDEPIQEEGIESEEADRSLRKNN